MIPYKNIHGNSNILEYDEADTSISIRFKNNPTIYTYNRMKPGGFHVAEMKKLARLGWGLATYINQHKEVKYGYFSKS
jgi:hypothetical protein